MIKTVSELLKRFVEAEKLVLNKHNIKHPPTIGEMYEGLTKDVLDRSIFEELNLTVSTQSFRNKIIAKLRDEGVIIASSSNGYKIPSKESELFDFVNHGTTIIYPMIARLRKCRDLIKLGTTNGLDLFEHIENEDLRNVLEQ